LLGIWDPNLAIPNGERLVSIYTALWGVHTSLAVVALPILLFVIELSKDQRQSATRSHEVLISETYIFPITLFSFAGAFRIGFDIAWFPQRIVFLTDLIFVFLLTLFLTGYAYFTALNLLFSPSRMKTKAMALAKTKMEASLDESIEIRIANNLLFGKLRDLKVGYRPFTGDPQDNVEYLVLKTKEEGIVGDVNLAQLEEFVKHLPWRERPSATQVTSDNQIELEESEPPFPPEKEFIWFMKKYKEHFSKGNSALFRLDKAAFEELNQDALEEKLSHVVKVELRDET